MKIPDYLFLAIMAGVFMFFVLLLVYATFRAKDDKDKNDGDPRLDDVDKELEEMEREDEKEDELY